MLTEMVQRYDAPTLQNKAVVVSDTGVTHGDMPRGVSLYLINFLWGDKPTSFFLLSFSSFDGCWMLNGCYFLLRLNK